MKNGRKILKLLDDKKKREQELENHKKKLNERFEQEPKVLEALDKIVTQMQDQFTMITKEYSKLRIKMSAP